MAELFVESGQSADVALGPPQLQGILLPSIDNPITDDGFGFTTPWGGGATARNYSTYGPSVGVSSRDTQLRDISSALFTTTGNISYNLEGLVGPIGPPGRQGPPGIPGSSFGLVAPTGVLALSSTLQQIEDLGTAVNQMIYTSAFEYTYTWTVKGPTDGPGTAGTTWVDCDSDMSNIIVSQQRRFLLFSSDYGDNFSAVTPPGQANGQFRAVAIDEGGTKLLCCVNAGRVWRSTDSGSNWTDLQPTGDQNENWYALDCDSDGSFIVAAEYLGRIQYSSDSGSSWNEAQPGGDADAFWVGVACDSDGSHIIVLDEASPTKIYVSRDSGASWSTATVSGATLWRRAACNSTGRVMAAVGGADEVFISVDGGDTFSTVYPLGAGVGFWEDVSISANADVIMVCGLSGAGGNAVAMVSFDEGATWSVETISATSFFLLGVAVADDGSKATLTKSTINGSQFIWTSVSYGEPTWAETTITPFARTVLDDYSAGDMRTTLSAQTQGDVLDDLNTLGAVTADGEFLVGTAAGVFAWESGATVRTSLGLGSGDSPTFTGLTLTGLTTNSLIYPAAGGVFTSLGAATNGQIAIGSTGAAPVLATITGTANQIISTPGAGTITLSAPQDIHTGASPTFAGGTFTGVVTGISPTLAAHLATKEYVDLSAGTQIDFFFSGNASGVGSNYLMYPIETGVGPSTVNSSALGQGNDQLCFSFLTEAGQPGINYLREGVYSVHAHLNNGVGQKSTTIYATISYVDSDGSSNETLVATSEVTSAITSSATGYDIHAVISADVDINTTKRVLVKFFANVGATGTNSTVTITMEGSTDSHVSLATSSEIYQRQGGVLDDLNTVGAVTGDDYMLVGTAAGVFAWETGATLRTSIGVDAAGTAAAAVATHESTYNHTNYNTAYSHSQLSSGNPHSVTPAELSLVIGTNVQAWDTGLDSLAALTYVSDSFIKVTATDTYAIRTIAETKSDLSLNNVENTALSTWPGTANIITLGTITTGTWNATAIGIAKGGTGQVTAQAAIDALTNVAAATNEHVLTKDTVTGNAIWKAAAGGDAFTVKVDAAATADYIGAAGSDGVLRVSTGISYTDGGNYVTLGPDVNALTAETDIDETADYAMVYDATAAAHRKVLTQYLGPFPPETTRTINFTTADDETDIQAAIDAIGRYIPDGVTVTLQFGNGTYTLADGLQFIGFFGGGTLRVQGNRTETNATTLHTTQDVYLDFNTAGSPSGCLWFKSCSCQVLIYNLKIRKDSTAGTNTIVYVTDCSRSVSILYCYLLGTSTAAAAYAINSTGSLFLYTQENYISNIYYGISSQASRVYSEDNDDTGTQPVYGLYALQGGVIAKSGTQITGSSGNETTSTGGVIR